MSQLFFSKYQLEKKQTLNAKDNSAFKDGCLIKIVESSGRWGVSDLTTWPNLGDLTLQQELATQGPLFQRALQLAQEDLEARAQKKSLLQDKFVTNNFLISDLNQPIPKFPIDTTVKIKVSFSQIEKLLQVIDQAANKVRIDFNSSLTADQFQNFLNNLSANQKEKIEYIEDPTAFNEQDWQRWNQILPLALDFAASTESTFAWSFLIIKPTRQDADELIVKCRTLNKKYVLTSSMDHPVGVAHGLRWAQKYDGQVNGFLTLDSYNPTEFNSYFRIEGCKINFADIALNDSGIGMTSALNSLSWIPYGDSVRI